MYISALFAVVQLVFIAILSITLFCMLFVRAQIEPLLKKKRDEFRNFLLQSLWPIPGVTAIAIPELGKLAKSTVKETIFKYIVTLKGSEKNKAIGIYAQLGLLSDDIKKLNSTYWWHRLEALVNIELIAPKRLHELVRPMVEDPHPLVGLYAVKVLSKSLNENEVINMLRLLRDWNYLRFDIYQEILDNFAKVFPDALVLLLQENLCRPKYFDLLCLRSLGKTMFLDVSPTLLQWTLPNLPENFRLEAIQSLGSLGDDRVCSPLTKMLPFEKDEVAAEIILSLGNITGSAFIKIPEILKQKPGPHVKRALLKMTEAQ